MKSLFLDFIPETSMDAIVEYVKKGDAFASWADMQPCFSTGAQEKINAQTVNRIAPSWSHDFMCSLTDFVFPRTSGETAGNVELEKNETIGRINRLARSLEGWFTPIGLENLNKWLDLCNARSEHKRSYGYELLFNCRRFGDAESCPVIHLLLKSGYFSNVRSMNGPLECALRRDTRAVRGETEDLMNRQIIAVLIQCAARNPRAMITNEASEAFARADPDNHGLAIERSVLEGLNLNEWLTHHHSPSLFDRLQAMQSSVDLKKAASEALSCIARMNMPKGMPGGRVFQPF